MIPDDKKHIAAALHKEACAYRRGNKSRTLRSLIEQFHKEIPTATVKEISKILVTGKSTVRCIKSVYKLPIPTEPREELPRFKEVVKKRRIIRTASPVTRQFFEMFDEDNGNQSKLSETLKISKNSLSDWRQGKTSPYVINFESAVDALGYRLQIVRKDQ